ncbi:MAG: hypothetical protein MZW92_63540 [Comamonadaceae bacterium]|nr:hypothetical protein [Comamonadaceae bacterium]
MAALGRAPAGACSSHDVGPVLRRHRGASWWARRPSASRAQLRRRVRDRSTPTPSAPRSRTCSRTRAAILEPAGALARGRRSSSTSSAHKLKGRTLRGHRLRRQHELRPPALRRRARRGRRAARGAVRGDDPRGARLASGASAS